MKTIFNTYIKVESQGQADRLKQLCIDNNLPIWDYEIAFQYNVNWIIFTYSEREKSFAVYGETLIKEQEVSEAEFIELLKQ